MSNDINGLVPDLEGDHITSQLSDEDLFIQTDFLLRELYPPARDSVLFFETYGQIATEVNIELRDCLDHLAHAYLERNKAGYYLGRTKRHLLRAIFESRERLVEDLTFKITKKVRFYNIKQVCYKVLFFQTLPSLNFVNDRIYQLKNAIYDARADYKGKTISELEAGCKILENAYRSGHDLEVMMNPDISGKAINIVWTLIAMVFSIIGTIIVQRLQK